MLRTPCICTSKSVEMELLEAWARSRALIVLGMRTVILLLLVEA